MDVMVRNVEREHWALACVDMLPWASASDLARCGGRSLPTCYQAMAHMEESGRGRCISVSTGGKTWRRVALVDHGRGGRLVRHQPDVVQWCCGKLELVEGAYRVLGDLVVAGRGRRLEEFRWEPGGLIDGVARFDDGWCAVSWSGRGETLSMLRRRLALVSGRGFPGGGWPGRWFVIVPDRFQAELVNRAAADAGLGDWVVAVSARDGSGRGPGPRREPGMVWRGAAAGGGGGWAGSAGAGPGLDGWRRPAEIARLGSGGTVARGGPAAAVAAGGRQPAWLRTGAAGPGGRRVAGGDGTGWIPVR